jgi:hypothetical protein
MACCENHDRMDRKLSSSQFHDAACGTPTSPDGEPRFCCRTCPAQGKPLEVKAEWVGNPVLLGFLSGDERAAVYDKARAAGLPVADMVAGAGRANVVEGPGSGPGVG